MREDDGGRQFIAFVQKKRKQQDYTLEQVCEGICSPGTIHYMENGRWRSDKLVRDCILDRLGAGVEDYEHFLDLEEYGRFEARNGILHCFVFEETDRAEELLKGYRKTYDMGNKLEKQFCLCMEVQIRRRRGSRREELSTLLEFNAVLEVGTADGKLVGILPGFTVQAILVEKGYTEDGGWTIEEYLTLMDKYPDTPLKKCTDTESALSWVALELSGMLESFVNWEERSCSFESEEFIQNIEMVKNYFVQLTNTGSDLFKSGAKMLYDGQVLTATVEVEYGKYFSGYQDIRDAFLDKYELAGIPNLEGEARYPVDGLQNVLYCMNAASAKKDTVWTFLEYILSEYQETMVESREQMFPARRDIVERVLQEEVEAELTDDYFRVNFYSKEMVPQRGNFTEEDKERVLYILDHTSPPTVLQSGGVFWGIMTEELGAFLSGDKTAEDTARILQNRVTTYLSE